MDLLELDLEGCAMGEVVTLGRGLGVVTAIGARTTIAVLRRDPAARDARRTGRLAEVPVGVALIGRAIDPLGAALDGGAALDDEPRRRLAARPLGPREHAPAAGGVHTGIKAIDVCAPLVAGTVVAACGPALGDVLATCVRAQDGAGVRTIVAALGADPVALRARLGRTATIVAAPPGSPPRLAALAPEAALAIAEDVRERGGDALVVIDDLDRFVAALGARTAAEVFSAQAALFARAGRRDPTRGGGAVTVIAARAAPPSARPSPLDALFAMDRAWRFAAPEAGLAALIPPGGLSKYAPPGTAPPLVPCATALRTTLAYLPALAANAIPRGGVAQVRREVELVQRLLDQPPEPVALLTIVAIANAAWNRVLTELAPEDAPAFERALVAYLAAERPDLVIDPTRRLDKPTEEALTAAAREVLARLAGN